MPQRGWLRAVKQTSGMVCLDSWVQHLSLQWRLDSMVLLHRASESLYLYVASLRGSAQALYIAARGSKRQKANTAKLSLRLQPEQCHFYHTLLSKERQRAAWIQGNVATQRSDPLKGWPHRGIRITHGICPGCKKGEFWLQFLVSSSIYLLPVEVHHHLGAAMTVPHAGSEASPLIDVCMVVCLDY